MAVHTIGAPGTRANDLRTIEDLGSHIQRLTALLRASVNTNDCDDEAWLVNIAREEAEAANARYDEWAMPETGEAK